MTETDLVRRALAFATLAHGDQKRKYTGEMYIVHPIEVMEIVKTVPHDDAMLAAALLHDVVEDTDVTLDEVRSAFGDDVAALVDDLTDVSKPEDGNRKTRKAMDREHSAQALRELRPLSWQTSSVTRLISWRTILTLPRFSLLRRRCF